MTRFIGLMVVSLFMLTACPDPQHNAQHVRGFWLVLLAVPFFFVGVHVGRRAHRAWRQR